MTMTAFDMTAVQARVEKYKAEWYELPPHFYEQKIIADLTAALAHIAEVEQQFFASNREIARLEQELHASQNIAIWWQAEAARIANGCT